MKKSIKIVLAIILCILLIMLILFVRKIILINKFLSFSFDNLDTFSITEKQYNTNDELYNSLSIYKYKENWHYTINDKEVYFTDGDNEMTVIVNGEKSTQEKYDLENTIQLYSTYLNWNSKNIFEKIKYIATVRIVSATYNNELVYKVSSNDNTWYLSKEDYVPVAFEDASLISQFEYSKTVEKENAILPQ
jgi:hypothetical protein